MVGVLDQVSQEELSHLIDVFCFETEGNLHKVWEAVREARNEEVEVKQPDCQAIVQRLSQFVAENRASNVNEVPRETRFEKCMNPPCGAYNDKVIKTFVINELNSIITANSKGMACVVHCTGGELSLGHVLSSSFNLVAAHHVAAAQCLLCSTEGSTLHVYDSGFPSYPQRKSFVTHAPLTALAFHALGGMVYCGARDGVVMSVPEGSLKGSVVKDQLPLRAEVRQKWKLSQRDVADIVILDRKHGNGTLLLVSSLDGPVTVLDLKRDCIVTTLSHEEGVRDIVWNPASGTLVSLTDAAGPPLAWVLCPPAAYKLSRDPSTKGLILVSLCTSPSTPEVFTLDTSGVATVWCLATLTVKQSMTMNYATRGNPSALVYIHSELLLIAFGKRASMWRKEQVSGVEVHRDPVMGLACRGQVCATFTASEVKVWHPTEGVHAAHPGVRGNIVAAKLFEEDLVLGTSEGEVVLLHGRHVSERVVPRHEPVHFILVPCEVRKEVVVGYESAVVLLSLRDLRALKGIVVVVEMRLDGHRLTCAAPAAGYLALGTREGVLLLVDAPKRAVRCTAESGAPHEINSLLPLPAQGQRSVVSLSASGRLCVWAVDAKGESLHLVLQKKVSNEVYSQHKAEAMASNARARVSLRRPALVGGAVSANLQVAFIADDAGWVTALDVCTLLSHLDSGSLATLHGSSARIVRQWQAHAEEILAVGLCGEHVVTGGLVDGSVLLWSCAGDLCGSVASRRREVPAVTRESLACQAPPVSYASSAHCVPHSPSSRARDFLTTPAVLENAAAPVAPTAAPAAHGTAHDDPFGWSKRALEVNPQVIPTSERSGRGCLWDDSACRQRRWAELRAAAEGQAHTKCPMPPISRSQKPEPPVRAPQRRRRCPLQPHVPQGAEPAFYMASSVGLSLPSLAQPAREKEWWHIVNEVTRQRPCQPELPPGATQRSPRACQLRGRGGSNHTPSLTRSFVMKCLRNSERSVHAAAHLHGPLGRGS